jgi:hypothetical protein
MTRTPFIDEGALRQQMDEGLTREQCLIIVARSAVIRHLATHLTHKDNFVLKGGALLHHVYTSPRFSVKDADFIHLNPEELDLTKVTDALTIRDEATGFLLEAEDGRWTTENEIYDGQQIPFSIEGQVEVKLEEGNMAISVCVRRGERLDENAEPLLYTDAMLAGQKTFEVQGLTRDELAAEKILGWCSKELMPKHYVDLGILARDHSEHLNLELVADLVRRKFEFEKGARRYRDANISDLRAVRREFFSPTKIDQVAVGWEETLQNEVVLSSEEDGPGSFVAWERVVAVVEEFWRRAFDILAPDPRSLPR